MFYKFLVSAYEFVVGAFHPSTPTATGMITTPMLRIFPKLHNNVILDAIGH